MKVFKVNDLSFKNNLTNKILNDLPEYLDSSTKERILSNLDKNIYFTTQTEYGFSGFASLVDNETVLNIDFIGVFKNFHRQKSGQALIKAVLDYARVNKKKAIIINIKDDSSMDQNYLKTRRFLTKMGFVKLCVIDSESFFNPTLVMAYIL